MYPEYVEVEGKRYKINTDFRVAIKCFEIIEDNSIGDFERSLGVICTLFGKDSIDDIDKCKKLLELAEKYLLCGKEVEKTNQKKDMDYKQDYPYIKTSFLSDYGIRLDDEKMHWWEFFELVNGLSNDELGSCCIFNRVRNLRNFDVNKIKDSKEKRKIQEAQKRVALKKEVNLTEKQKESVNQIMKDLGIKEG